MSNTEISFPSTKEDFTKFIVKILGRGVIKEFSDENYFDMDFIDIEDLNSKIIQRVESQNTGELFDFKAHFQYQDGALDKIPSLSEFESYRPLNRSLCIELEMTYAFLLKFSNSEAEKQAITIKFSSGNVDNSKKKNFDRNEDKNFRKVEIEYSDATWAYDILNLFKEHIQGFNKSDSRFFKASQWIENNRIFMSITPILLMVGAVVWMLTSGINAEDTRFC